MLELHVIILAAGKGMRMHSSLPKALQPLAGKPMLYYVLQRAEELNPKMIHLVYGFGGDKICAALTDYQLNLVEQKEQLGTGHAVQQVLPLLPKQGRVLILFGDVPLISLTSLHNLIKNTPAEKIGLLTVNLPDPTGFGRIVRDASYAITGIVEEKDATPEQRAITEINTGIMLFPASFLHKHLLKLQSVNAQHEYYLTDIIALARQSGCGVVVSRVAETWEVMGVNDKLQLAQLERCYQKNKAEQLLRKGVTIIDPVRFDLRGEVGEMEVGQDVVIDVNVILTGEISLGDLVKVGANCCLTNVKVGNNVVIQPNCVIENAIIDDDCVIGPFARIRPDSHIKKGAHIGNFVEIKKSTVGQSSKVNRLTYLGDTIVGDKVNIGAGTITCNYDGVNKYQTIIKDGAFIGSNSQLVAPVCIGKNATIGAGSTITEDAPAGKLTLARAKQVTIEGWKRNDRN